MAIKHGSKVDKSFSSSAMTDLMFLLLIFMILATTLINNPNALRLLLPKSANKVQQDSNRTTVSIQHDIENNSYNYYVNGKPVSGINEVEEELHRLLDGESEPTVSLQCDKSAALDEVVKVMNIAKDNDYKLILDTQP
ncbi:MAG: biopolymer transporter ExbD [Alistipes sp.]|nr:biopolymer transporter ExbD [Alistipes sp.]